MTEYERFIKIHIGTPHEYVIKDINNNETYGMFKGDDKAVIQLLKTINELNKENEELKERVKQLHIDNMVLIKRCDTLISENEDLNISKEYWREKCLSKDSYNKFHFKAPIWFTQELKLTNKEVNKLAEAIEQDLNERRIKE